MEAFEWLDAFGLTPDQVDALPGHIAPWLLPIERRVKDARAKNASAAFGVDPEE